MRQSIVFTFIFIFLMMLASCSHRAYKEGTDMDQGTEISKIAQGNNQFALDLLKEIPYESANMVISPFSISTALAMTYVGARNETLREMAEVMHFDTDQVLFHANFGAYLNALDYSRNDDVQLNIANSIWAQQDYNFLQSFFDIVEDIYDSKTFQVDFRANREVVRKEINDWVYDETREKIEDLIAPGVLTDDTRMVLVNAIHFLGPWLKEFDPEQTRENHFYLQGREFVMADFMHSTDTLPYFEDEGMQLLEIPYSENNFSMVILLPKESLQMEAIEKSLSSDDFENMLNSLESTEIDVFIPKFEAETKLDLEEVLIGMGMAQPFNRYADFSGMTGDLDLKIDKVIHQAMIEVAEEGTEAAAATAVVIIRKTSIDPDPRKAFIANKPFLFFIKENQHNSILFAGRVMNPSK